MTVKEYPSVQKLLSLAKSESNPRLARRIQAVAFACRGHSCPGIIEMTGNSCRAIQSWVAKLKADSLHVMLWSNKRGV